MQNGLFLEEYPFVLCHHCNGLMYRRPKGIALDADAISPNSFWNLFTVTAWPSLILPLAKVIDTIQAGDGQACMVIKSYTTPRKVVLCIRESTQFLGLVLSPGTFCEQGQHLDAESPSIETVLELTSCRCNCQVFTTKHMYTNTFFLEGLPW